MTKEVDAKGYYIRRKHDIVSFFLDGQTDLKLNGFSQQNVIFGLSVQRSRPGLQLLLDPCHGLAGPL